MAVFTGTTIEEAKEKARVQLKPTVNQTIEFTVFQQPRHGFLGIGRRQAQVDAVIKDKEIKQLWDDFRQLSCVYKGKNKEFFCKQIPAKKRYIDVYVENKGRISKINKEMAQKIQMFLVTDLSEYLWGKCE